MIRAPWRSNRLALKRKQALDFSVRTHSMVIYGAEYDNSSGEPIRYWYKDSLGCGGVASSSLENAIWELTTIDLGDLGSL